MDVINKVGETVINKGKDVAQKAKEIVEVTSLYTQINVQKGNLNRIFQELGKLYYEQKKAESDDAMAEKCNQINAAYGEIERLNREILIIKKKKKCHACGVELPDEAVFCLACGVSVPADRYTAEEEMEETCDCTGEQKEEE